ncbi:MAG TPA: hypothetical protein PKZ16_01105 [bacterium]|nr:hypothetical protein [bacterium]HPL95480.1 hypothetical protein [bacterium]
MDIKIEINENEQKEKFEPKIEIGGFSDIESSIIFSAISKTIDHRWGNEQNKQATEIIKNQQVEISEELLTAYDEIKRLAHDDEETLRWLAFVAGKDQKSQQAIIDQMVKYKDFNQEDALELLLRFISFYLQIKEKIDLSEIINFTSHDIDKRKEQLPELERKINEAIKFFNPRPSRLKKIIYLPTNPLTKEQSGYGLEIDENYYVSAELGNEINEIHEFLHSIINPVMEKIKLSADDEKIILELCPNKLKSYQYPQSILTEEIIRTYKTGFKKENEPSFDNFRAKLLSADKSKLQKMLNDEKQQEGAAMAASVTELLTNDKIMRRYYEKYGRDILSERIWQFFAAYSTSGSEDFESYFLDHYQDILHKNQS